jgi:predicted dehydrogenase
LVEKPIDITLERAEALVAGCRAAGVRLGVISQHRFAQQIQRLRQAIQEGELGRVLAGDASVKWFRTQAYYDAGDWRGTWALDGGGCLMNQGVHTVDMIQWTMGGVRSVQATVRTASHTIEVEDQANLLVEYRNGAIGVIQASTCSYPGFAERLEVTGEHGTVILEGDRTKVWRVDPERAQMGKYGDGVMSQPTPSVHLAGASEWTEEDPSAHWGEQHRLQIEDFARAVVEDRDPFVTGEMALEPLRIILAAYESSRRGGARVQL